MEPTESAAPDARLRVRRISGAWRRGATRTARSRGAGAIPGADSPQAPGTRPSRLALVDGGGRHPP
ncbi:hypothetical protein AB0889_30150, partial [Streptomyces griseoaurantiacus]